MINIEGFLYSFCKFALPGLVKILCLGSQIPDHNYDHNRKNEGEQRVRQTNFCREKRTTKVLNTAVFKVFNHPCYCYEPFVHRGPRKAFGFVGKGETYGVFVTNWLDNLFEYGICLDAVPRSVPL